MTSSGSRRNSTPDAASSTPRMLSSGCSRSPLVPAATLNNCCIELDSKKEELHLKDGELASIKALIDEHREELASKEKDYDAAQVDSTKKELALLEEIAKDLEAKNKDKLESFKSFLQGYSDQIELKKKELTSLQRIIEELGGDLEVKSLELGAASASIVNHNVELAKKMREIESVESSLVQLQAQVKLSQKELGAASASIVNHNFVLDEKKREIESVESSLVQLESQLKLREALLQFTQKELDTARTAKEQCFKDIELKNIELEAASASVQNHNFELDKKSREIESVERSLVQLQAQVKLSQKELGSARTAREECLKEIESAEASSRERLTVIAEKERQLQLQFKELKCQQEHLSQMQKSLEDQRAKATLGEGAVITHPLVKVEKLEYPTTPAPCMDDQLSSMLFICGFFERHDFVHQQLLDKIQMSLDPAKLVLQAMQDFHWSSSRQHERRFNIGIINRSCLLLLNYLAEASPNIVPQVKEAAMALATRWKGQLRVSPSYVHDVLVLLRTIVVYKLTAEFSPKELEELVKSISEHGEANEIRGLLGLTSQLHFNSTE